MKRFVVIMFISLFSFGLFAEKNTIKAAGDLTWFTSYSSALVDAKAKDNIIIVNFTGSDWCQWCKKLATNVFSKDSFHKWQEENATLLFLDFPQKEYRTDEQIAHNQMLAELYGIQGFPTILILSKYGQLIGKSGYAENADKWISNVEKSINQFKTLVESH